MSASPDEIRIVIKDAVRTAEAGDRAAGEMAEMLVGRLRQVSRHYGYSTLRALKRELRDFDMTTGKWKQ